jgi:hypothetical protein
MKRSPTGCSPSHQLGHSEVAISLQLTSLGFPRGHVLMVNRQDLLMDCRGTLAHRNDFFGWIRQWGSLRQFMLRDQENGSGVWPAWDRLQPDLYEAAVGQREEQYRSTAVGLSFKRRK